MATASIKLFKPEPPPKTIVLELNEEEVYFLNEVFSRIGGNPELSKRKHADNIYRALALLGYDYKCSTQSSNGSIIFHC